MTEKGIGRCRASSPSTPQPLGILSTQTVDPGTARLTERGMKVGGPRSLWTSTARSPSTTRRSIMAMSAPTTPGRRFRPYRNAVALGSRRTTSRAAGQRPTRAGSARPTGDGAETALKRAASITTKGRPDPVVLWAASTTVVQQASNEAPTKVIKHNRAETEKPTVGQSLNADR